MRIYPLAESLMQRLLRNYACFGYDRKRTVRNILGVLNIDRKDLS